MDRSSTSQTTRIPCLIPSVTKAKLLNDHPEQPVKGVTSYADFYYRGQVAQPSPGNHNLLLPSVPKGDGDFDLPGFHSH